MLHVPEGRTPRRAALVAALAVLTAGVVAASAPAFTQIADVSVTVSPSGSPIVGVSAQVGSSTVLNDTQTAVSTVPGAAESVLCPASAGSPELSTVACNLGALSFAWYTSYRRPDGTLVNRLTGAVVNVPTYVNVDDDIAPDVVARVQLLSPTQISIHIDRAPGETATLPASVEAIVADPTKGDMPRKWINYGYDARESRAPATFLSSISLNNRGKQLVYANTMGGAGNSLKIVGGLFNGTPAARTDRLSGGMSYSDPVPANVTTTLNVVRNPSATLTTTTPTTLGVFAEIDEGAERTVVDARIDKLPTSVTVAFESGGPDQRKVVYDAATPIDTINATVRRLAGTTVKEVLRANVSGLPKKMTLTQTGPQAAVFSTEGGKIGAIEVGFANGEPRFLTSLPANEHYLHVFDDGTLRSISGRVTGIERVSVAGGSSYVIGTKLGNEPLVIDVQADGVDLDGRVEKVPGTMTFTLVPGSHFEYEASSEIDKVDLHARGLPGGFGEAHVLVEGVPAHIRTDFGNAGHFKFNTFGSGIDKIEAEIVPTGHARFSGLPAGDVAKVTTGGGLHAFVRILDLDMVEASTATPSKSVKVRFDDDTDTGPKNPLTVEGQLPSAAFKAYVDELPQTIGVTIPQTGNLLEYDADRPIGSIKLDAAIDGAAIINATITNVPSSIDVCARAGLGCNRGIWYDYLQKFGFGLDVSDDGPKPNIDAVICLGLNSGSWAIGNCGSGQQKVIYIDDLQFRDVFFELGGPGKLTNGDDDNIPLYAHTSTGITVKDFVYSDRDGGGSGIWFGVDGNGLGATDLGLLIDTTVIPTIDDSAGSLNFACRDLKYLRTIKKNSSGAFVSDLNLTGLVRTFLGLTGTCS